MQHVVDDSLESDDPSIEPSSEPRKPYHRPAIIHELQLETRAGSPIGLTNILNPFDPRAKM
jgi:hypothetical protein